jgi:hypothetical protein
MTERERWIVYPLLFLALGAALRDKLSEHTKNKRIECQELIVFGDDSAGMPPVPLVQIGAVERKSADAPHVGQIVVSGQVVADAVQAEAIQSNQFQANEINAGNYYFRRVPFAPLLRAIPGTSAEDLLRAQQQANDAQAGEDAASSTESSNESAQAPSEPSASAPAKSTPEAATPPENAALPPK